MKRKDEDEKLDEISKKLEDMDNKLERIKSDTHNLNRIASLSNSQIIIQELRKIIRRSEKRAAILYLTKEEIGASELAEAVGINPANLAMYMKPFLGNRGYIAEIKRGRKRYFQRSALVDLIGFESTEEFASLLKSWNEKRTKAGKQEAQSIEKEDADAT